MAAAYVRVYMNGCHVRTYGGNKSDVRWMEQQYKNMTREEFMNKLTDASGGLRLKPN